LNEYRERSHENWERIGANWDAEREYIHSATRPVNERIVERLDPEAGNTILDLAAGTGETGFLAMAAIGNDGKLISTDFAQSMVDAARRGGESLDLNDAEFRVLDAEKMDLEDSSVDRVLCRFGYMLMADPASALAETNRVLRDDGRLCFAVWTTPEKNQWAAIPASVMVERGHAPPPEPGAPGIMSLADPERIKELVGRVRRAEDRAGRGAVAVHRPGRALGVRPQARRPHRGRGQWAGRDGPRGGPRGGRVAHRAADGGHRHGRRAGARGNGRLAPATGQ
jgi:SAM-dependent methyltransferase